MNVSPGDVLDRLSILKLKMERTEDKPTQEYESYTSAMREKSGEFPTLDWDLLLDLAYRANGLVWDLEGAIRNSQLDDNFVEAGKRAIMVRKVNGIRVGLKNLVNSLTGEGFLEVKKHHLSE
jgi:hypothetical protein